MGIQATFCCILVAFRNIYVRFSSLFMLNYILYCYQLVALFMTFSEKNAWLQCCCLLFFQKSPTTIITDRSSSNTIFTHGISRYVLPFDAQSGSFKKWCGRKNTEMQHQFQQGNQSENCRLSFTTIDHCSDISFCQPAAAAASLILLNQPS